jgi:hypothetical protein
VQSGLVAFSRSRLKTSPAAPLTLHFLVTLFDKAFAFAIAAFLFRFACVFLHVVSNSKIHAYYQPMENAITQITRGWPKTPQALRVAAFVGFVF